MAKPTDLSPAWWRKHEPETLQGAGFGKALDLWAKAEALEFSLKALRERAAVLRSLEAARQKAKAACDPLQHGDALQTLEAYKGLIAKTYEKVREEEADFTSRSTAKPTDFSKAWWQKHKPPTLQSTGYGKALELWTKVAAKELSQRTFHERTIALRGLESARQKAIGMCDDLMHGDALKALVAYKTLIVKAAAQLREDEADYDALEKELLLALQSVLVRMTALAAKVRTARSKQEALQKKKPVKEADAKAIEAELKKLDAARTALEKEAAAKFQEKKKGLHPDDLEDAEAMLKEIKDLAKQLAKP